MAPSAPLDPLLGRQRQARAHLDPVSFRFMKVSGKKQLDKKLSLTCRELDSHDVHFSLSDDLKDILEEEIEDMRRETTMQENVDKTMEDLAREERRMNPRTRGGEDEAIRKMEKHIKSTSNNKKKLTSSSNVKKGNEVKSDKKQNENLKEKETDGKKEGTEEKVEKEQRQEKATQGKNYILCP